MTHIAGKIKVGSSTNPIRLWLGQGSDAGICVAEGVGLAPRALEHQIGLKLSLPLAVRITQKMKFLGKTIGKDKIHEEMMAKAKTKMMTGLEIAMVKVKTKEVENQSYMKG